MVDGLDLKRFSGEGYRSAKVSTHVEFDRDTVDLTQYAADHGMFLEFFGVF